MPALRIVIPAAGAATRMRGGDKLLEPINAEPLLRRQARLALSVCDDVVVTLRINDSLRSAALMGLNLFQIAVPDAAEGMAASLRMGSRGTKTGVMVLPADMPEIDADDLRSLIAAHLQDPKAIWRGASADGRPGHPVIFPADLVPKMQTLQGDQGARAIITAQQDRVRLCVLPDNHALTDLDTPEDWHAWRALTR